MLAQYLATREDRDSQTHLLLRNKVAIVTGSTAGIGKAIAKVFLQQGAFVFINGRSEGTVSKTASQFAEEGLIYTHGVIANLGTKEGTDSFFEQVETVVGGTGTPIDIVVNNVGIFETKDFFEVTDEEWLHYYTVNVLSTVRLCRHYLRPMLERNAGRLLIISSESAARSIPDMLHYTTTKSAQVNLARGLAELTKGTNVTVNSILPGPTATEGLVDFFDTIAKRTGQTREEAERSYFTEREPTSLLQRLLTPEEVANVTMFLASDLSSGVNGTSQRVEGGIIRHL
jgi:NAD(P)-dependent dehydrogenase (short-subunit alcohol dehydrogenase family)